MATFKQRLSAWWHWLRHRRYYAIHARFQSFSMIPLRRYVTNLKIAERFSGVKGLVVECGTWRGGMVAGIAQLFANQNRTYYLFDSFEGLPEVKPVDGEAAKRWQTATDSPEYFNNCSAPMEDAQAAMRLAGVANPHIVKGWFSDTLPHFDKKQPIAILRLDGDWYDSTMQCLENLYDSVVVGGCIILDDYDVWEGCSRAVHDFLSRNGLADRIWQLDNEVCFIVKTGRKSPVAS